MSLNWFYYYYSYHHHHCWWLVCLVFLIWELHFIEINLWNAVHLAEKYGFGFFWEPWCDTGPALYSLWVDQLNFSSQIQLLKITETTDFSYGSQNWSFTLALWSPWSTISSCFKSLSFTYLVRFFTYIFFLRDSFCFLISSILSELCLWEFFQNVSSYFLVLHISAIFLYRFIVLSK